MGRCRTPCLLRVPYAAVNIACTARPGRIVRASFVKGRGSWSGERSVFDGGCLLRRVLCVARAPGALVDALRGYLGTARSWPGRVFRHVRTAAAAYAVLLLALVLTGLAWYYVRATVEEQNNVRFDETVQATRAAVDRRTDAYLDALFGARGVFLASNAVERQEWESYVSGIETKSRLEGLQAIGFARYVTPEEREDFEQEVTQQGRPGMRPDLDPGGGGSAHFPLSPVAPPE